MQENEVFVIDLSGANTSGEIINSISLALEIPNASGRKIAIKLKETVLNQSQLLSIQSLIQSYGSTLTRVETQSLITYGVCEGVGIPVSKSLDSHQDSITKTPVEFAAKTPEQVFNVDSPEQVFSEDEKEPVEDINVEETIFEAAGMSPSTSAYELEEKGTIGVYKKAEEDTPESIYEEVDFYAPPTDEPVIPDSKQTIYVSQTLRSGQILEFDGNVVIIGDCHPGSEIKAAGDITVWGVLGSIAHAGNKGNREAKIRALKMHAVQLRIANCYSRRPDGDNIPYIVKSHTFTPEEARIVDDSIVLFKI